MRYCNTAGIVNVFVRRFAAAQCEETADIVVLRGRGAQGLEIGKKPFTRRFLAVIPDFDDLVIVQHGIAHEAVLLGVARLPEQRERAPCFLGTRDLPVEDVMVCRCEGEVALGHRNRDGISRPPKPGDRKIVVAPYHHAQEAIDDRHGGSLINPIGCKVDVHRLHVLLRLRHEDQLVLVERDKLLLLWPRDLVIHADMKEARIIANAELSVTLPLHFLGIVFRAIAFGRGREALG